ncbi:CBS domain-containing protein [Rhodococcus pyridinivorans]
MDEVSGAIRFLAAFAAIEKHFEWKLQIGDGRTGFVKMAEQYARQHHTQLDLPALRTFADLRNALVHNDYYGGKPVADPVPEIVDAIERLRDKIIRPPTVLRVLPQRPLVTFQPSDPLQAVLEQVRLLDYSQFPLYENHTYHGLLTTNCVARWLAHRFARDELVEGETVRDAFEFVEPHERAAHLARKATVPQAIKKLSPPADGSLPPVALIVTHSGKPHECPLSIVVAADLPVLVAAMNAGT